MRHNTTEKMVVNDKAVFNNIRVAEAFASSDFVYTFSERQLSADLKRLGDLAGLLSTNLPLCALRRGGVDAVSFTRH